MFRLFGGLCAAVCVLVFSVSVHAQDFSPADWRVELTGPGSGIQHLGDGVSLLYRPHLVSKTEWTGGTLAFEWTPPELPEKAPDGRQYGDHLALFLSSDGSFRDVRSFEVKTGVVVRLDGVTGDVRIQTTTDGENFETIKSSKGVGPLDGSLAIVVTDKNGTITVSVDGKEVVSTAVPATARKGKVWGLYNREPVANARNISMIKKITYKP